MGNYIHVFLRPNNNKINNKEIIDNNNIKKIFKSFNILDINKNIIIGIWDNPNKSNTMGNQGIWIGNNDEIYELIFGINCNDVVILYFKNNIILEITKINDSFLLKLKKKNDIVEYSTNISNDIIKKLNKINNNSADIDLIFNIIKK